MTLTLILVIATVLVSLKAFSDYELQHNAVFSPYRLVHFREYHRLLSHMLIHGDMIHLFFNMYVLYAFGDILETIYTDVYLWKGRLLMLAVYVLGGVFACLPSILKHRNNDLYRSLGASGAVSAVLYSVILWLPDIELRVFFYIPMKAWVFGLVYLGLEYYLDKRGGSTGIAHDAHYFGALFGVLFNLMLRPELGPSFIDAIIN